MTTFFPRLLLTMFGAYLALGTIALKAAVAPRSLKKGNMVDLFLTRTKAGVFKPILPNGIVVDQGA